MSPRYSTGSATGAWWLSRIVAATATIRCTRERLTDDCVRCHYHGFTYDDGGACVRIPGQSHVPDAARVRSYPVIERHRWIWVWMGEPALADESKIVDFHWLDDPRWSAKGTVLYVKSSYELIVENLLDLTHLTFVHQATIGNYATAEKADVTTQLTDHDVTVARWMMDSSPPPTYAKLGGGGHDQHRSLAIHQLHAAGLRAAGRRRRRDCQRSARAKNGRVRRRGAAGRRHRDAQPECHHSRNREDHALFLGPGAQLPARRACVVTVDLQAPGLSRWLRSVVDFHLATLVSHWNEVRSIRRQMNGLLSLWQNEPCTPSCASI